MKFFTLVLLNFVLLASVVDSIWLLSLFDKNQWSNLTDASKICDLAPTPKTKRLCLKSPQTFQLIGSSVQETITECQEQQAHERWDCAKRFGANDAYLKIQSKENAFLHGLISLSSSRALSKACSKGQLDDCTCGELPTNGNASFIWAGCSDNLKFGNRLTRQILDSTENKQDANSLMNIHNNKVGQKILSKHIEEKCKCHGISGSCVTKTCWKVVSDIPNLVAALRKKYLNANQVEMASNSTALILVNNIPTPTATGRQQRSLARKNKNQKPTQNELVFIDETPDFCSLKQENGAPLSVGRECANEKECNQLCCNRGFIRIREVQAERCNCRFIYCCKVECDECKKEIERFYCK